LYTILQVGMFDNSCGLGNVPYIINPTIHLLTCEELMCNGRIWVFLFFLFAFTVALVAFLFFLVLYAKTSLCAAFNPNPSYTKRIEHATNTGTKHVYCLGVCICFCFSSFCTSSIGSIIFIYVIVYKETTTPPLVKWKWSTKKTMCVCCCVALCNDNNNIQELSYAQWERKMSSNNGRNVFFHVSCHSELRARIFLILVMLCV
jgi:hypothetical protein